MASLLGKADPTLVSGALTYAKANIPGDLSSIYKTREATQKKWMDFAQELQTAWDNKDVEWNNDLAAGTEQGLIAIENLGLGKQNTAFTTISTDAIIDLTNQYKSYKDNRNPFEERKIQAELTKFATTIKLNSERFEKMSALSMDGGFIVQGTGDEIKLWNQIMNDFNNDTNLSNGEYKDGDIVYTFGDLSMTMTELENKLVKKDSAPGTSAQEVFNSVLKSATETKRPNDDQYKSDVQNKLKDLMFKRSDRINIMHEHFEGIEFTFFEALTGKDKDLQEQIYNTLENLSGVGLDLNKDGIKDSEVDELGVKNFDYTTAENAMLLQEAILDSPYSSEIVSGFLVDNIFDNTYNRGQKERTDTKKYRGGGGGGGTPTTTTKLITGNVKVGMTRIGGGVSQIKVPVEQVDAKYNKIVSARNKVGETVVEGWEGARTYRYIYTPSLGKWRYQIFDPDLQQFRTYGGSDEDNVYDEDGKLITEVKVKHLTTKEVLGGSHLNINERNSNLGGGTATTGGVQNVLDLG